MQVGREIVTKLLNVDASWVARDVCKFASIFTLALLSVDRCLASYHHLGALRTIGVGKTAVCVIWIACGVLAAPYLTYAGVRGPSTSRSAASCQLVWPQHLVTVYTAFQCLLRLSFRPSSLRRRRRRVLSG